jgi:hypothetical protein
MLEKLRRHLITHTFILSSLFSIGVRASELLHKTGVGTRGTSSTHKEENLYEKFQIFNDIFPQSSSEIGLDNGYIVKLSFEAYLNSIEKFNRKTPIKNGDPSVKKWILEKKEILKEKIYNSSWVVKEYKTYNTNEFKQKNKFKVSYSNGIYTLSINKDAEENPVDIKNNIIQALAVILKTEETEFTVEEITKELLKSIIPLKIEPNEL